MKFIVPEAVSGLSSLKSAKTDFARNCLKGFPKFHKDVWSLGGRGAFGV